MDRDMTAQTSKQQWDAHARWDWRREEREHMHELSATDLNLRHKLWDCYGRGKKQRLSVVWFQSPFKHFNAPGIQLKDAIIFFTTHATSPLFSPYNCTSTSYFIDVAGGRTCGYPVASQLTWAKRIFGMYTLIRHRSHFQAFKHKIHQQTATLKHPSSMSNYLFLFFLFFFAQNNSLLLRNSGKQHLTESGSIHSTSVFLSGK